MLRTARWIASCMCSGITVGRLSVGGSTKPSSSCHMFIASSVVVGPVEDAASEL